MSITPEHEPAASEPQQPEPQQPEPQQPELQPSAAQPEQSSEAATVRETVLTRSVESGDARIRRAPKFGPFLIIGGGVGAIVTFILTMSFPADPGVGFGALFGYFSLFGVPAGVAIGAVVVLIVDRVSIRRSRAATVEHETVEPESYEGTLEN
ncbi:DUF3169 family protein [Salinibacterium sp. M195]|uniref:DUF3169 family protein n=1 Tax=Salinibacterium sp. M195 TaxID=2583374 RepID=UPI001C625A0F|nr:DUF3169 family protein [Salinibacterium sp. M195]QYH35153.1 hypothetical protein FFT87_03845 [Salinibacterium sp. M195]